ncbi:U-box domain-containing protein 35-like isoform X2 [Alnus glutinosa]|uniref:U-box domain-containing protein 35-like isoform X2 n=1 Tax=Alnus glutinosa TaxID=3517 RepID=UPI002D7A0FBD|nr:U-box domain-containing protein 35-like isoform X2 [Alnus glutinosa]
MKLVGWSLGRKRGAVGNHDQHDEISRTHKQQLEHQAKELFLPYRCFCTRKDIKCNEVILEAVDVAKALIEYVSTNTVEVMVFGAATKSGLVRRFKTDIPSSVSKGAPDFCTVYVIAKGKISNVRPASASLPSAAKTSPRDTHTHNQASHHSDNFNHASHHSDHHNHHNNHSDHHHPGGTHFMRNHHFRERAGHPHRNLHDDEIRSPFGRNNRASMNKSYELSMPDTDISFVSNGRPSVERIYPSLYDNLDSGMTPRLSTTSEFDIRSFGTSLSGNKSIHILSPQFDYSSSSHSSGSHESGAAWGSQNMDEVEAEMRRLRLELKQTMDMYNTACKEALTAKQKALELHRWKVEEEHRLEEARMAEEAALAAAEKEKAKCKAALEAAEAAKRIAALEAKRRMNAEMRAMEEAEERKHALTAFAHNDLRYRRYTIEEIEAATDHFAESRKIGEGGYGPVYMCELDHTQVAVKVLRPDAAQGRSQFQQEVEVLSCIRHPNMVLLLGACPEFGCLVYEYMANGSLEDRLFRRGDTHVLPWQLRFRIAAEIGTGLLFLHQTKPEPLVHRDLKPANILLDRNYVSKISDVGLARLVPPSVANDVTQYRMTSTAGTFCYIDPEYQQTGMLGIKSDVYSLGVMLLQIVTAKPPMGLTHHVERAIERGNFNEMIDPAVPDWPVEETLKLAKLALQCAEMRRKDRPDLGHVVLPELNRLRALAEDNMFGIVLCNGGGTSPRQSQHSILHDVISDTQPLQSGFDSSRRSD